MRKPTMWILTRSDTNQAVQPLERARGLKFCILEVEVLYYPSSEKKDADQLRGYREADLHLCFRICRLLVFSWRCSFPFFHIAIDIHVVRYLFLEIPKITKIKCTSQSKGYNLVVKFFKFFETIELFWFVVPTFDLVHDVEAIHCLSKLLTASGNLFLKYEWCLLQKLLFHGHHSYFRTRFPDAVST